MSILTPRSGAIAVASNGDLGIITSEEKVPTCVEGRVQMAWRGIQLRPVRGGKTGDSWSSRNPNVIGYVEDLDVVDVSSFLEVSELALID